MIPNNVTLIVKAPNQQIEDQNIECQSSWTVKQLKGHLSEVYPNKPKTEEQKIIYSGQLLDDNTILKDVLRTYESQIAHTMHLVCTPHRRMAEPIKTPEPPSSEGLRRRNTENVPPEPVPRPEMSQNHQNHTVEMQNYLNSAMNNYGRVPPYPNYNLEQARDPGAMANQMLMMQQAYMQYMQQYALWQASIRAEAPPAPAPAPEPPADDNDELPPRDWLDHVYTASRLAILSSLIYLYGSGPRLLLVIVLAVAGYLHQIGFFRDLNLNPNALRHRNQQQPADNQQNPAGNQPNPAGNQPNAAANQPNQPGNEPNLAGNQPNPAGNQTNPTGNQNQQETEPQDDNHRSLWAITWMVFTTFFASLIPEANNQ